MLLLHEQLQLKRVHKGKKTKVVLWKKHRKVYRLTKYTLAKGTTLKIRIHIIISKYCLRPSKNVDLENRVCLRIIYWLNLLEQVLRPRSEHKFFVDLHVEFAPFGLKFASACRCSGIRTLKKMFKKSISIYDRFSICGICVRNR